MPSTRLLLRAAPFVLAAALAGCGNKGDLVKPTPPAPATPAPAAADPGTH